MSMEQFTKDMNIIAKLDDEPNDMGGLTAEQLKAKFDEGGLALQKYINEVILPRMGEPWQGDLLMNGYRVTNLGAPVEGTDALRKMDAAPAVESTAHPGCYYRTVGGVTEWVNPPMTPGVEYRTTERHEGKVVYTKLVNLGTLPAKNSAIHVSTGVSATAILRIAARTAGGTSIPYSYDYGGTLIDIGVTTTSINVWAANSTVTDFSGTTGTAQLWYTKD